MDNDGGMFDHDTDYDSARVAVVYRPGGVDYGAVWVIILMLLSIPFVAINDISKPKEVEKPVERVVKYDMSAIKSLDIKEEIKNLELHD